MSGRGKNFPAEEIGTTVTYGRRRNSSRKPGTFQELKKAVVDEAKETMVQGQAGVKASGTNFGHDKDFGPDLMRNRKYVKEFKLGSDMNRSVFWTDNSGYCMETRLVRVKMDQGRTDELQ